MRKVGPSALLLEDCLTVPRQIKQGSIARGEAAETKDYHLLLNEEVAVDTPLTDRFRVSCLAILFVSTLVSLGYKCHDLVGRIYGVISLASLEKEEGKKNETI